MPPIHSFPTMAPCRAFRLLLGIILATVCALLVVRRDLPARFSLHFTLPPAAARRWLDATAGLGSGPSSAVQPREVKVPQEDVNDLIMRLRQQMKQLGSTDECDGASKTLRLRGLPKEKERQLYVYLSGPIATSAPEGTAAPTMESTEGGPSLQPKVTTVESHPATKAFASISVPRGSIWCGGNRTYWITGHQRYNETPWCEVQPGRWERSTTTFLDVEDELNFDKIDRHDCLRMDVNWDGLPDIICGVGAGRGRGEGYNELYLTRSSGKLHKIQSGHGLQKYPTMRNRYSVGLSSGTRPDKDLIFMATEGMARADGQTNVPRMFRNIYESEDKLPYFVELPGPWTLQNYSTVCNIAGDFNNDGADDLIMCDSTGPPLLAIQIQNETRFEIVPLPRLDYVQKWMSARLADITLDGHLDLIVTTIGMPSTLYIFKGKEAAPYFNFHRPYYQREFEYFTPDIEVLDINLDGIADIYAIQTNVTKENYCGRNNANAWWGGGVQPPTDWVPPVDDARDVLLVGTSDSGESMFDAVTMSNVAEPGCGNMVARFDPQTLLLSQGTIRAAGHHLLLEW